ncbi:conserved membrane protein of unknown function [Tenacibaculum sp. 190130A14a]|uniref:YhhN-like protein n=1 Tax=Tenacibaculum polynesiense TaxID=3137857 RepID=A0ABM9PAZ6_9FLAO
MDTLFYIGFLLAIFSFLIYLLYFKKKKVDSINYFVLFLFCMFFFDALGLLFFDFGYNNSLYNLLSLLEFNVLFVFYLKISQDQLTKKTIKSTIVVYNLILIVSSMYYGMDVFSIKYNTIAPLFGALLIAIVLLLYLREILLSEEILNYKNNVFFWITTGLLLYYLGTMPLTAIFNLMKSGSSFYFLYKIQYVLTIIMHGCFILGLLWSWKRIR